MMNELRLRIKAIPYNRELLVLIGPSEHLSNNNLDYMEREHVQDVEISNLGDTSETDSRRNWMEMEPTTVSKLKKFIAD
jgi:hypothetical protein